MNLSKVFLTALLGLALAVAPFSSSVTAQRKSKTTRQPAITLTKIYKDIEGKMLEQVPSAQNGKPDSSWTFEKDEPREIEILQRDVKGDTAKIIVKIYTQNVDDGNGVLYRLKGNLQLQYERIAGGWSLENIENISLRYTLSDSTANSQNSTNSIQNENSSNRRPTNVYSAPAPPVSSQPSVFSIINSPITIAPGVHYRIRFVVETPSTVIGRFRAQGGSGNDIKAYILSEDGYENFKNGHTTNTFYNSGQVTVGSINTVLGTGAYYLVFDNAYSAFSNKVVNATIEMQTSR